jgi:hypothetical protein
VSAFCRRQTFAICLSNARNARRSGHRIRKLPLGAFGPKESYGVIFRTVKNSLLFAIRLLKDQELRKAESRSGFIAEMSNSSFDPIFAG